MNDLDKNATTVAGQPTGDTTESGNPTHNADGTFGSKGQGGEQKSSPLVKASLKDLREFLETYQAGEDDELLDNFDLNSITEYKDIKEMSNGELATEIKSHREFLSNYFDFSNFGVNAFNGDLKLQCSNFRQLKMLVEKYPLTTIGTPSLLMNSRFERTIARVTLIANNKGLARVSKLQFNSKIFSSYEEARAEERGNQFTGYSTPSDGKKLEVFSLTHEYGHMLETEILNRRGIQMTDLEKGESQIREEIIQIFNEQNNYSESFLKYMGRYGLSDSAEFFAEAFANMNCGKPNKLGKAMEEWLRRNGGMK